MENDTDKTHQPTPKKLDDARKKGEIPRSQEIGITLTYLSLTGTVYLFGGEILKEVTVIFRSFLTLNFFDSADGSVRATQGMILDALWQVTPFVFGPFLFIVIMIAVQRSAIIVGTNIVFKLDRISPIAGFKKKFGINGLFEFLKSFAKLILFSAALTALLFPLIAEISNLSRLPLNHSILFVFNKALILLFCATAISAALAVLDYYWQVSQFIKKNMMTFQEIKDEHREAEGDPHFKGMRRQRALEIANNRMIHDVPNADVVIVNPTHYAVALEWKPETSRAPVVLAKGVDEFALKIREVADDCGIPVHVDITTARQLTAVAEIGEEVPVEFYQAVAAAIRFAQSAQRSWR